jgi:hypothetical protein
MIKLILSFQSFILNKFIYLFPYTISLFKFQYILLTYLIKIKNTHNTKKKINFII